MTHSAYSAVVHPAELVVAFDAQPTPADAPDVWQNWWLTPADVRDLYSGWVRNGRTGRDRRRRAAHAADLSARGLLVSSVQPARRGPLQTEIRRAVVGYVVVTTCCGVLLLAVTAATGVDYHWQQLVGFAQLNAGLAAAPVVREWWRHRRAPISPDPSTYRSPTSRGPAIP